MSHFVDAISERDLYALDDDEFERSLVPDEDDREGDDDEDDVEDDEDLDDDQDDDVDDASF